MASEVMKRAWQVRRVAAHRLGCDLMDVLWGECLAGARKVIERERVNAKTRMVFETRREQKGPGLVVRVWRRLQGWRF